MPFSKCYNSTPTERFKILQKCINSGHDSVLEHSHITFEVDGVSRALLAQLTRHRIASFSVQSQKDMLIKPKTKNALIM